MANGFSPSSHITDSTECNIHEYDYATGQIAAITSNDKEYNEYNILNATSKPPRGDQIYDHIPNELPKVNATLTKPKIIFEQVTRYKIQNVFLSRHSKTNKH